MHCAACGHTNRSDRRFCAKCGRRLGEVCRACGTLNELGEQFCGHCGGSLTGTAAEGERRQLTVLFCDLVGSTSIAGQLDPEDWRAIVAQYHHAAAETVTRFGGHVAVYLGDGLLVYFGYPQAHEDDPERAVRAGLALLDAVAELNRRLEPAPGVRLAVRVGMHTGPVVIGGEGTTAGAEVFGDTPNVAARVQALAPADSVLITEATHRLVAGRFIVEAKGAPPLKGVRTPVEVYRVVQPSGVRSRLHTAGPRGLTPFVGREAERRLLAERWAQARAGEGQVVLITGEAGIGKSRLVATFKENLAGESHTWVECAGSPYHQNSPFYALTEMLGQALAGRRDAPVEGRVTGLEQSLAAAGLALPEALPLVAPLLNLPVPEHYPSLALSPEGQRKKLLGTLVASLVGLARVQPVVAVLEDLQWVDPSTLELQGLLVEQGASAPVLLLYTARPEFRAPWPLLAHHAQVTLGRLGSRQVREMVAQVAARAVLAEPVIEAVVTRTDGNPLYVEELTKAVLEGDTGDSSTHTIPASLQDSLMARLDRLGGAKEVAQVGAVIGREFSYELLHAVSPLPEAELQTALARLADAELLYPRGRPPAATYVFKHALVQEMAYTSLLKSRRRELHGTIARLLAERFRDTVETQPELLAYHYAAAVEIDAAIGYYQRAGEQTGARSAHEEAIVHLRNAIALLVTLPDGGDRDVREVPLQLALGSSLIKVRGYAHLETEAAFQRARTLCDSVGDRAQLASAFVGLSIFYNTRGPLDQSVACAERIFEIGQKTGEDVYRLAAHHQLGIAQHYQGKFAASLAHLEQASALGASPWSPAFWPEHEPHALIAANLWYLGYPDQALARLREAISLARSLGDPFDRAYVLFWGTHIHWLRRDMKSQEATAAECIAVSEAQGFQLFSGLARAYRAAALVASGAEPSAVAEVSAGLALASRTGQLLGAPHTHALLAEVRQAAGQPEKALRTLDAGHAVSAQTGQPFFDAELHRMKGELLLSAEPGRAVKAEALFRRALEIARGQEAKSFELRAATSLARLLRAQGKPAEARMLLAPVYAWFTEGFDTRDLVEAKALLDELG